MQYGCSSYGQFELGGAGGLVFIIQTALSAYESLSPLSKAVVNNYESSVLVSQITAHPYESLLQAAQTCATDTENQLTLAVAGNTNLESLLLGLRQQGAVNFESKARLLVEKLSNTETLAKLSASHDHTYETFIAIFSEAAKGAECLETVAGLHQSATTPFEVPREIIQVMIVSSISILTAMTLASVEIAESATITSADITEAIE